MFTVTEPDIVRVNRGYNWLTNHGLERGLDISRIDPATIQTAGPVTCPLAQASGRHSFGVGMHMAGHPGDFNWALNHGFWATINDYGSFDGLPYHGGNLDAIWRQLLTPAPVLAAVA